MKIQPARSIQGRIQVPGDKSISHRAAIIAALATTTTKIRNFSTSLDCANTLSCLQTLGVSIREVADGIVVAGRYELDRPSAPLDCGNSGTTMRLLAGVLSGQDFDSTLIGDESLSSRPMQRVIEPLELMGARISSEDGKPPLTISGSRSLKAIAYELPVPSAQVKSAILLAALSAEGETHISESHGATRDHTERMLAWFGATVTTEVVAGVSVASVIGPAKLKGRELDIPGDLSAAAYFIAGAALLPDSNLTIDHVGLNPTRTGFLSILRDLGVALEIEHEDHEFNEPLGSVRVFGKKRSAVTVILQGKLIAQLIDELPLLAVVGSQLPGGIEIRDAAELRLKESDRIATTAANLRAMGIDVEEFADGMRINPGRLRGATIRCAGDHRIAMAFTIAALLAEGDSEIEAAECVNVSFPEFFQLLDKVVVR